MAWRWFNATIMLLCVVLILALQGLPAPVTSSGWRVAETGERSPERSQSTGSSFAIAEPAVNFSFVAPSTRTAADPMVDLRAAPVRTADPYFAQTPGTAVRAAASLYGVQTRPAADPYVVLGVATAPRNTGHRAWIRETWMTLPNVVSRSTLSFFVLGLLAKDGTSHDEETRRLLHEESDAHGDMQLLNARETKPPGEKMIGFFRLCVIAYAGAKWCIKTDDDTYVHTIRLEHNLRQLWMREVTAAAGRADVGGNYAGAPMVYMGATIWASYIEDEFAVCGHGMGPNMAAGAAKLEGCKKRGAIGPFPFASGTLEVLSMPLAEWIVSQPSVARFVQRAQAATPHRWNIGEDTVLGMWVHMSPFAITALHWGWDKIHDLCFTCKDTTQLWKPLTTKTVVVHIKGHQANRHNFLNVHRNFSRVCDAQCQQQTLDFDVPSLADLCRRGTISQSYTKCAKVSGAIQARS